MTISVKIENNEVAGEADKTFRVKLIEDPSRAFTEYPNNETTVTIKDDDGKLRNANSKPSHCPEFIRSDLLSSYEFRKTLTDKMAI